MYAILSFIFGLALDLFYRRRHLGGSVPTTGPVLIVANHPNALMDPLVVLRAAGRRVQFLAKAPLFKMPVLGALVRGLSALPVYRAKDGANTAQNDDTFAAVYEALRQGACVCIFPEGISHSEPALQPLKTGAARMALGAEASADFKLGVQIVPFGMSFSSRAEFRSAVATECGAPIAASSYRDAFLKDEREAAVALTAQIERALRAVTLNLDSWEDLPLLETAAALDVSVTDPIARQRRIKALAEGAQLLREHRPEALHKLRADVVAFKQGLDAVGISPAQLTHPPGSGEVLAFILRNIVALLVGLPCALVGGIVYAPPFWTVDVLVRILRPEPDVAATYKLLGALMFFPVWQFVVTGYLVLRYGWPVGLAVGLLLPLCGMYTRHFFRRRTRAMATTGGFFRLRQRILRAELLTQANAIVRDLDEVRADVERLREAQTKSPLSQGA